MGGCHDFINGFYYEDGWTGETISEEEYNKREWEKEKLRRGQHYILIKMCEAQIKGEEIYCDLFKWHYHAGEEKVPENVVILSEKEYIKNEKRNSYYRRYKGNSYVIIKVAANEKLKVDKTEEVFGFFLCTVKGKGTLYTKEEFRKKFLLE